MDAVKQTEKMTSDPTEKAALQNQDVHTHREKHTSARSGAVLVGCAVSVASLSGLMLGYEMGIISGVLLQLRDVLALSCLQQEQTVGALLLGAFLISVAGGAIVDRYGRRFSIVLTAALCAGGTLLSVAVPSFWALAAGRALVGMALALSGTASCLYVAEVAPAAWRGRCVCVYELMVVLGVLLGFGLSWAFAGAEEDGWRFTLGAVLAPTFLQAVAMPLFPQSPRFLLARGREREAVATLARLRGGRAGRPDVVVATAVEEEIRAIRASLGAERQQGFLDLFRSRDNMRRRTLVGMALVFLQQVTGQPNLLAYASTVLQSVGFHSNEAATLASTGLGVVKVGGAVPAMLLADRVGPKAFLCVGAVVMTLSTATLGAVTMQSRTHVASLCQNPVVRMNHTPDFRTVQPQGLLSYDHVYFGPKPNFTRPRPFSVTQGHGVLNSSRSVLETNSEISPSLKWTSLVALLVYVAAFSFSLGPMVYVVLSEIFPTGIRGKAVSVVSAFNWATNLLISMTFLTFTGGAANGDQQGASVLERIGLPSVVFSYSAMSFVLLVFVILFIPETKGRSLEQISKELAMKNHLDSTILCHSWRKTPKTDLAPEDRAVGTA